MEEEKERKFVLLGFENVIVPGIIGAGLNDSERKKVLAGLSEMEKEGRIKLFLVSGCSKEMLEKRLDEYQVRGFFRPENIRFADDRYIEKREEIDRKRYAEALKENPEYDDEYLKVQFIEELIAAGTPKESIIFFGHDLMTDAYYLRRYCGTDTALLKSSLSFNNKKAEIVKGLIYVSNQWDDFRDVVTGRKKAESYSGLEDAVFRTLREGLLGESLGSAATG
jgi:hypothetical protein